MVQAGDGGLGHAGDAQVVGRLGQLDAGGDADRGELVHLVAAQARHEGEVIVGAAAVLALVDPAADAAVVDRVGIGVAGVAGDRLGRRAPRSGP